MSQIRVYDFTYSKALCLETYSDRDKFVEALKKIAKKWCFQEEKGDQTDYLHYQGRMTLISKKRPKQAHVLVQKMFKGMHVSPTVKENRTDLYYVMKEDTRVDGPWTEKDAQRFVPEQFRITLRPWQQTVLQMAQYKDTRSINVIIDEEGGKGKSTLAGYAVFQLGYYFVAVHDSVERMVASVCDMLMSDQARNPKCFFVDIPRSFRKSRMKSLFLAIEQIKNGWVSDSRYHYRQWGFNTPCVWVFCNRPIRTKYLSKDRWRLFMFQDEQLVPYVSETKVPIHDSRNIPRSNVPDL